MKRLLACGAVSLLSACTHMNGANDYLAGTIIGAESLSVDKLDGGSAPIPLPKDMSAGGQRLGLLSLVHESIVKCDAFQRNITTTQASVDTTGDILATGLSALSTAFAPVATSHALSAASTIVSGSKTAADSDIFAKASIPNLVSALNQTYYKNIRDYKETTLPGLDDTKFDSVGVEYSNQVSAISLIHQSCALGAIETSIGNTIAPTSSSNQQNQTKNGQPADGGDRAVPQALDEGRSNTAPPKTPIPGDPIGRN